MLIKQCSVAFSRLADWYRQLITNLPLFITHRLKAIVCKLEAQSGLPAERNRPAICYMLFTFYSFSIMISLSLIIIAWWLSSAYMCNVIPKLQRPISNLLGPISFSRDFQRFLGVYGDFSSATWSRIRFQLKVFKFKICGFFISISHPLNVLNLLRLPNKNRPSYGLMTLETLNQNIGPLRCERINNPWTSKTLMNRMFRHWYPHWDARRCYDFHDLHWPARTISKSDHCQTIITVRTSS